ncbi:RNA 2'-phosphotransferase [Streptomyces polyrhachis]|uniref:Probable RNA 2'-phosphotransferase n=1 Tax=Streptomyces polyrhachis TaxID=1282885 RepID=A0ABW2GAD1_9ACTN
MDEKKLIRTSKRLSHCLRHDPGRYGLRLDEAGWVAVDELLAALARHDAGVTRAELEAVVAGNDKRRFAFSDDGRLIRASQGHSIPVDLGYEAAVPPPVLYHGTVSAALGAIRSEGLRPMRRHAVHLSAEVETARRVGARRGRPVVLRVAAGELHAAGREFRRSANGVWLVDAVPPEYLASYED